MYAPGSVCDPVGAGGTCRSLDRHRLECRQLVLSRAHAWLDCSSFIFRQLEHPETEFGKIRLWGTVGWVVASWCVTAWLSLRAWWLAVPLRDQTDLSDSLRLGALAGLALAFYSLTLPHTPPLPQVEPTCAGQASVASAVDRRPMRALGDVSGSVVRGILRVLFQRLLCDHVLYHPAELALAETDRRRCGTDPAVLATLSQSTEILLLAFLPSLLRRFGMKATMLARPPTIWTLGLVVLGVGAPDVAGGGRPDQRRSFHLLFRRRRASLRQSPGITRHPGDRAGVLIFISGTGMLLGHLLVGWIRDLSGDSFRDAYLIAACISGLTAADSALGIHAEAGDADIPPAKLLFPARKSLRLVLIGTSPSEFRFLALRTGKVNPA